MAAYGWAEPGWSADGDVDDGRGEAGLVEQADRAWAAEAPKRPRTRPARPRPCDREGCLADVVAGNVRVEAGRVGVTQAQLARVIGLSRSAVSLRYRGLVPWSLDELEAAAGYINVPVAELLAPPRRRRGSSAFPSW